MKTQNGSPERRGNGLWAGAIFVILFTLFWILRQESYWSDARHLIRGVAEGNLRRHHFAYPSIGIGFHRITEVFGNTDPKLALQLLSVLSGATAGALLFLTARRLGFDRIPSLAGVALAILSPVGLFYSTCVEVHALQLAFACGAGYWAACTHERAPRSALVAAVFLSLILGSHMAGLLWGPAILAFLVWDGSSLRRPRHLVAGILVLIAAAVAWRLANPGLGHGTAHVSRGLRELLKVARPELFWGAIIRPMGVLPLLAILATLTLRGHFRERLRRPLLLATAILFGCMLPFAATLDVLERGGYYITLLVPFGLMACHAIQNSRWWVRKLAPLAILLQLYFAGRQYYEWEYAYPGADWIPALQEETADSGIVIARELWEWEAIQFHTGLTGISPSMPQRPQSTLASRGEEVIVRLMRARLRLGEALGVTRNFWESEDPLEERWQELLRDNFGEPKAGKRPEYLLFETP